MVKVSAYLIAFYLVYTILLSRDTAYGRNRAFILVSIFLSLLLPFITLQTIRPGNIQFFGKMLSDVFISEVSGKDHLITRGLTQVSSMKLVSSIYFTGVIILLIKLLADLINLLFLILQQRNEGSRIIRFHGFNTAGFSAMGYIFISSRLSRDEAFDIVKHEQNHIKQKHFFDIIFIETIKAFQWFNPVIYLFSRSLRAIHEYQADQECLNSGIPVVSYQSLLMKQVFKSGAFNLSNSFSNPSLVKKRMIMMTKKRTSYLAGMKLIAVIPVTILLVLTISGYKENSKQTENLPNIVSSPLSSLNDKISGIIPLQPTASLETQEDKSEESKEEPFVVVEEMPMFPGGDMALLNYISQNTIYPEEAKTHNIEGKVIVRFCITEKGSVSRATVLKGVAPDLDAEAIRVVKTLPQFNPGKQGGKPVPVWYMVPITYTLK